MPSAKTTVRVALSVVVSAVFIAFSLRHTDPRAVLGAIAAAARGPLVGYLLILLAVHVVRTVRWGLLLAPVGRVGWQRLNSASAIGFMLLAVLPLRLGELGRPLLVSRPSGAGQKLSRSGALASCVVERIIDGIAVGVLGIVALHVLATTGTTADRARTAANLVTAAFGALLLALVVAFLMRERAVNLVRSLLTPISPRLGGRVAHMLDSFVAGLHLGSAGRVLAVLALTVATWGLHLWGFWMVASAFGIQLTGLMAATVLAANVVGVMIPAGPGGLGPSQLATLAGVSIFYPGAMSGGAVAVSAVAYAHTIWLIQFLQAVGLGVVFLLSGHVSLAGLFEPPERLEPTATAAAPPARGAR
jgi:uncharacterized protein (TIRG00374 family)